MDYVTLSPIEFRKMLMEAAEIGAKNALIDVGETSPIIWRVEAIKRHGEKLIKRFEKHGLLERKQHYEKGNYYYDVKELNYALTAENRIRFLMIPKDEKATG
ncbi:hypothetical protein ORI89_18680 [Sphingobacterium sp. UT-1RO-CII-1]|uniref:hypothetical protein n=1 Tax=Sphingobacterium sp. UT-1RO-CII-1 TaxID=2995225 RepID=UPI00227B8EBB|nr:hypothetical protein [Sphingobacterium sp. UT-1RO-CII-1]MCY4781683.1 hypothetical protein [Sphingobacterium sp. UT-1RO-CII-1]